MVRTRGLVKRYGRLAAVDGLDLHVRAGEIYGFLGPNGAGKTSTLMMLLGIARPTAGEILLFGERYTPKRVQLRCRIGVVPERHPQGVWRWMTAAEYLQLFADLFRVNGARRRIEALLERVALAPFRDQRICEYSRGMLQKLSFVRALLPDPDLLLLDEPISGLDPLGIRQVRDLIQAERREGRAILISSHHLSEMERLCDRVGIIARGRLLAEDAMGALLARISPEREIRVELERIPPGLSAAMRALPFVAGTEEAGGTLVVRIAREGDFRRDVAQHLFQLGLVPLAISERAPSLEEAFVTITGDTVEQLAGRKGP